MERKNEFIKFSSHRNYTDEQALRKSIEFKLDMLTRRTIRMFSDREVSAELINNCLQVAGSAPSGANMQPWHFVIVRDKEIKKKIREGAEKEEREFYASRAPEEWLEALEPLGTDQNKPFLESAPVLIVIFEKKYGEDENGKKIKHYYTKESIGIATGFLIAALHKSGLATLTHTPSPMNFLNDILHRPKNEKPFLILVVGHPAKNAMVPNINKKSLDEISSTF